MNALADWYKKHFLAGIDPAAPEEDRTVVLQRWQEELLNKVTTVYGKSSLSALSASGSHVIPRALWPVFLGQPPQSPFPYGTIIRPTAANENFPPEHRQMVIGMAPGGERAICALDVKGGFVSTGTFYAHTIEGLHDRWEEDS